VWQIRCWDESFISLCGRGQENERALWEMAECAGGTLEREIIQSNSASILDLGKIKIFGWGVTA